MYASKSLARFVGLPENRSALAGVQELAKRFTADPDGGAPASLFLHGPPGTGKTHLAIGLIREVTRRAPEVTVAQLAAADLDVIGHTSGHASGHEETESAHEQDLVVIEDVQLLSAAGVEPLVQLIDRRLARRRPTLLTARLSPQALGEHFPARLTSRLASGLVIALDPLPATSRLRLLEEFSQRRQLAVPPEVLRWLADNLIGGGRVLQGCVTQLDALSRLNPGGLDVAKVARHFRDQVEASRPTVERIAQRVGGHFGVETRQLQSRRRHRNVLWPRQVGMFLARRLTGLSLDQIGAYFGGRDHTTVLHACRKVADAMKQDGLIGGAVRQLHADLC
jgi:chromosomal replication initiator protein